MSEETQLQTQDSVIPLLADQARAVWKRRYLVLIIAAACLTVVVIWTLQQPKIYRATITLEFDPNPPRPLGRSVDDGTDSTQNYWMSREYFSTQHQILASQRVAEGVVRQLGLQHDADFLGIKPERRAAFRSWSVSDAAGVLRTQIRVEPQRESRLVNINIEDVNPRRAQLIANTLASVYMRQNLDQRLASTVSSLEWLQQQQESLRTQLEQSERTLHDYRMQNNLLSISYEDRRNHLGNRISNFSNGLTEANTRRIAASARVAELRRAAQAQDPLASGAPELLASALLQTLRTRYEEARRERESLATRYGPNAQQMLAAESRVRELADAIRQEVRNILTAAESELRAIRTIESGLRAVLNEAQREALELNLREIEYGRLARERENNSKLYSLVLERTKETDLSRLLRVNNVRVVDPALLPTKPVKPRMIVNVAGGAGGSLIFSVLVVFLLLQLDRTVRSQADIEEELQATFLGIIPRIQTRMLRTGYRYQYGYGSAKDEGPIENLDLVVHTHPNSSIAEACRVIRTNLLFMSPDKPFQVLMVSSAVPREGKTTSATSLAIALAQSGKKVLLIDTDLRRPRLHKVFKLRPPVGITSVLVQETDLADAVINTEVPNLQLLPCGPIPPNPSEILHSQRFIDLIEELRKKYDRIIFDTPPISAVTDALIISTHVDATVFVVRWRASLRARAKAIMTQLRSLNAQIAGIIMNDVDTAKDQEASYYYYAGYYERSSDETN